MKDHLEYCAMKPIQCKYCELVIPVTDEQYEKHIGYCGSKTRDCEFCGSKVMQREMQYHLENGQCDLALEIKAEKESLKLKQDLDRVRNEQRAAAASGASSQASTGKVLKARTAHEAN